MGIKVLDAGLFTTIQDLGRTGHQRYGFAVSGVMDKRAGRIANMLVGNTNNEAMLETTMAGPMLEFTEANIIAVTGRDWVPQINGKRIPIYKAVYVKKGDILSFGGPGGGLRSYIAFGGGLDVPEVMGSRSTHTKCGLGGLEGRNLQAGDEIVFAAPKKSLSCFLSHETRPDNYSAKEIELRVILGPQEEYFTHTGIENFFSETYEMTSESDRMGCRLEGKPVEMKRGSDIISDGIALGAIQVPSHGKPIIMLADRQTTGGYAKIGTVCSVDIPKLVQAAPGSKICFKRVSILQAQDLYREEELELKQKEWKMKKPCTRALLPKNWEMLKKHPFFMR